MKSRITILVSIILSFTALDTTAATIKGHILDSKSKEALLGAIVYNKVNNQANSTAGLDCSYSIKNLKRGSYVIAAQLVGYVTLEKTVVVADSNQTIIVDFLMDAQTINLGQVLVLGNYEKGSDNY